MTVDGSESSFRPAAEDLPEVSNVADGYAFRSNCHSAPSVFHLDGQTLDLSFSDYFAAAPITIVGHP
jgi:hypothetical protein